MKNLLIITQKVDENDDLLGFFVGWLREFSKKFDKVFVITLAKGDCDLPENVFIYSLGKEKNSSRLTRFVRFYWHLFRLVPRSNGVFAHMSPIFAIMVWPAAAIFRKRIILWYLHRSVTRRLKIAEKLSYKIVTSTAESLNIKSRKIVEIGHGIDIGRFRSLRPVGPMGQNGPVRILSVGRISKIKDYETLVRAAKILKDKGFDFNLKIVGRPVMSYDLEYFESLKKLVQDLGLENEIKFVGFVPYSRIADYYKESDIFVNLAPKGGIDKAVLEAMASGSLVLAANEAFKRYFGRFGRVLVFTHGVPNDLAQKIEDLLNLSNENWGDIVTFLQRSVEKNHSVQGAVDRISRLFA